MNKALKPVWVVLVVFAGVAIFAAVTKWMAPQGDIRWRTDYAAATVEARAAGKPLFLEFSASWCEPCQSLKTTTWADRDVQRALNAYVTVSIDVDQNPALAEQFHIDPIPAFFVVDPSSGRPLKAGAGAMNPEQFLHWLNSTGKS